MGDMTKLGIFPKSELKMITTFQVAIISETSHISCLLNF